MNQPEIDRCDGFRPGVGLLLVKDGRILIGRGASWTTNLQYQNNEFVLTDEDPSWKQAWEIPQGGIEEGETFHEALFREGSEELGPAWRLELEDYRPYFQARMQFPVHKDGRNWLGKSYHFHLLSMKGDPEGFSDWVYGYHMDEGPHPFPTPGFPGGVIFLGHRDARNMICETQRGRKGRLLIDVIDKLRCDRLIRP